MSGEKKTKKANDFMRRKLGPDVDAAAGAAGFRVLDSDTGGEDEHGGKEFVMLPGPDRQGSAFARDLGKILAAENIFRRDSYPVAVDPETGSVSVITADDFRTMVEEYCVPYKLVEVRGGYDEKPMTMTKDVAGYVLRARPFVMALRKLERVNLVQMPVWGGPGTEPRLLPEGYDEETRTFTLKSDIKLNLSLKPEEGQTILWDFLKEFPYTDPRSKAVAIAALVAVYVSQMQELTANRMSFVNRSNVEGAGKSLLAATALTPAYGLVKGQPLAGREELRKLLDATAMQGLPYIFLDNLTGHVASELLDAYLTTPIWTGRVLGTPKIFEAPANAMLFITGNGITISPDIARRSLVCNLHVESADPEERQPKRVMTPQFLARPAVRGDMLSALWAMVRGWHEKKCPGATRRIRSFEEWCDIVGGIVLANGFGDALEKPKDEETANPKEVDKRVFVQKLAEMFPEGKKVCEFEFQEMVEVCVEHSCFEWIVSEGTKKVKKVKRDDGGYDDEERYELKSSAVGKLSRLFNFEMGGQVFALKDGRRVRFGKRGNNRHRRYLLELVETSPPTGTLPGV